MSAKNNLTLLMCELVIALFLIGLHLSWGQDRSPFQKSPAISIKIQNQQASIVNQETASFPIPQKSAPTTEPIAVTSPIPELHDTSIPSPTGISLKKSQYSIALFGDSMIETLGSFDYLKEELNKKYPDVQFSLYNYGLGSQNIEEGLARLDKSVSQLKPDILILGSFSYNPLLPYNTASYSATLKQLIKQAKILSPEVYLLAEIAPLKTDFGKGPKGVNWSSDQAYEHATQIIGLLEQAVSTAQTSDIPVINVFQASQTNSLKEGNRTLINTNDNIHPSVEGQRFTAKQIASALHFD